MGIDSSFFLLSKSLSIDLLIFFAIFNHFLNFILFKPIFVLNNIDRFYVLLILNIESSDFENVITIQLKDHFNFHLPLRLFFNIFYQKIHDMVVFGGDQALSFIYIDVHIGLIILHWMKDFFSFCRNWCVSRNLNRHFATTTHNTQWKRCHVEQNDVLIFIHLPIKDRRLNRSTIRHSLIWIQTEI